MAADFTRGSYGIPTRNCTRVRTDGGQKILFICRSAGTPWLITIPVASARLDPSVQFFNTVYTGWHGRADIWWPGRGLALQIEAQAPLNRYIVYSPGAEADFFCFEPVSHDVNAHNAPSPLKHGLVELAEGESLHLSARFTATLR